MIKSGIIFCTYIILMGYSSITLSFNKEEAEKYLDDMLSYQLDFTKQEKRLSVLISEIKQQLSKNDKSAYYWYLKARSSFAGIYTFDKKDKRYAKYKNLIPIEFMKALSFNKINEQLTDQQLKNILTQAYSNSVSVEATRQYIGLKKRQKTLHEKEHLELLWERVVSGLLKQNKFDEAYEVMAFMESNFPPEKLKYVNGKSWRLKLEERIEKQKANANK